MNPIRVYVMLAGLAALLGGLFAFALHERDVQHQKDMAKAQAALNAALLHNAELEHQWAAKLKAAEDAHAKELTDNAAAAAAHPMPSVRLCHNPSNSPLPSTTTAPASVAAGPGSVPGGDAVPAAGPELGPGLELLSRSADSVVAACRVLVNGRP